MGNFAHNAAMLFMLLGSVGVLIFVILGVGAVASEVEERYGVGPAFALVAAVVAIGLAGLLTLVGIRI